VMPFPRSLFFHFHPFSRSTTFACSRFNTIPNSHLPEHYDGASVLIFPFKAPFRASRLSQPLRRGALLCAPRASQGPNQFFATSRCLSSHRHPFASLTLFSIASTHILSLALEGFSTRFIHFLLPFFAGLPPLPTRKSSFAADHLSFPNRRKSPEKETLTPFPL